MFQKCFAPGVHFGGPYNDFYQPNLNKISPFEGVTVLTPKATARGKSVLKLLKHTVNCYLTFLGLHLV